MHWKDNYRIRNSPAVLDTQKSQKNYIFKYSINTISLKPFPIFNIQGLLEKYLIFGREKKKAYLERWKPNLSKISLLGTSHTSPRGTTIVGNIPGKLLLEQYLTRLSLQS